MDLLPDDYKSKDKGDDGDEVLGSIPTEFEVWCNNGMDWYSVEKITNKWKKLDEPDNEGLISHTDTNENEGQFDKIQKFNTGLSDPTTDWSISEIWLPPTKKKWLSCRIIFTSYYGYALGAKVGINVRDDSKRVCQKCCNCSPHGQRANAGFSLDKKDVPFTQFMH